MSISTNSYDDIPYQSVALVQSHPERLATVATLLGLRPPPIQKARVLEIGCAMGGNLIPMAEGLPQASFVGIDLSVRQVVEGQDLIRRAGLDNVRIEHRSIVDVGDDFGTFDYIICHGVFSWVPVEVQEKIYSICKRNLAPDGVAYISYNTLPGWHMRGVIRDMMLFHSRQFPQPSEQIRQARGILDFFAKSISPQNNPYGAFLQTELESLRRAPDSYLFHEHLEAHNSPIYFIDFMRRAEGHGLRFLAEADLRSMMQTNLPKEVQETLQRLSTGHVYLEQYMDFLRNRTFRQTLLCHADRQPNYTLTPQMLSNLYVAAPVRAKNTPSNFLSDQPEAFTSDSGVGVNVRDPIVKSALAVLGEEWPRRMSFHVLRNRARARLEPRPIQDSGAASQDAELLGLALLHSYATAGSALVELSLHPLAAAVTPGEKPRVATSNRLLAAAGKPVTNLRHEAVPLGEFERQLIQHLDGTHDRGELREMMAKLVGEGVLTVQKDGQPITDAQQLAGLLDASIEQQLARFVRQSLLLDQPPAV